MHTSFEDLRLKDAREGNIGRIVDGELIWDRPRTRHEAGYRRSVALTLAIGIGMGVPFAIALVFMFS